jgi:hypothetical protein
MWMDVDTGFIPWLRTLGIRAFNSFIFLTAPGFVKAEKKGSVN